MVEILLLLMKISITGLVPGIVLIGVGLILECYPNKTGALVGGLGIFISVFCAILLLSAGVLKVVWFS